MKILFEWLKELAGADVSVERLVRDLPLIGMSVDAVAETEHGAGTLLDLEITTNRPDLLSHYGVAREVAALYGKPPKPIEPRVKEASDAATGAARIEIADADLCHRYVGLVLRNVKVGPSPDWLVKRLVACDVASINNVVDVSNYVLLELGHPTHAFDLDTLAEKTIVVRRARGGEGLLTLDGVQRALKPSHLVIADARRPVALAGIMGGAETEISFRTKNVLLESAWFDPLSVRRAAKEIGLRTEASYRFERGMDVEAPLWTARRCAELILKLAGGELLAGAIDAYPRPWEPPVMVLRQSEIERILGQSIPAPGIERILSALGFKGRRRGEWAWEVVSVPWRRDVTREIDLIEELARLYGYDKFPARLPTARQPVVVRPHEAAQRALRTALEAQGYDETVNFSLVNPAEEESFLTPGEELAPVLNPLSEEAAVLRPSGLLSLVKTLAYNVNRGQRNLRLYEIGKAYALSGRQFRERSVLTLAGTGLLREKNVHEAEQLFDLFALKGAVEAVLELFELPAPSFAPHNAAFFHAGVGVRIAAGKQQLGMMGHLHPTLEARFKLRQAAWLAELDLDALYAAGLRARRYERFSHFPAVARDFSLVLADAVSFGAVRDTIAALEIPELVSVAAVDRFRGAIPKGQHSLLVRVVFQSPGQTLTDEQIRAFTDRIVTALERKLGASLRA